MRQMYVWEKEGGEQERRVEREVEGSSLDLHRKYVADSNHVVCLTRHRHGAIRFSIPKHLRGRVDTCSLSFDQRSVDLRKCHKI